MKNIVLSLALLLVGFVAVAQTVTTIPIADQGIDALIVEEVPGADGATGMTKYRLFIDMEDQFILISCGSYNADAVAGTPETFLTLSTDGTSFFNDALFGGSVPPDNYAGFVGVSADLAHDSYLTCGRVGNTGLIGVLTADDTDGTVDGIMTSAESFGALTGNHGDITEITTGVDGADQAGVSVGIQGGAPGYGANNIVYVGQLTTDGAFTLNISATVQSFLGVQYRINNMSFPFSNPGCDDAAACNYDATATENDGSCVYVTNPATQECAGNCCDGTGFVQCIDNVGGGAGFDQPDGICDSIQSFGCRADTEPTACNADSDASLTHVPTSCIFAVAANCEVCAGGVAVVADSNADGQSDCDDVPGCTNVSACNYNAAATLEDGSCIFVADPVCEVCSGETDGTGTVIGRDDNGNGTPDCDESHYLLVGKELACNDAEICVPIVTSPTYTVDSVIGYDIVFHYNRDKLRPDGTVIVKDIAAGGLIEDHYTDYIINDYDGNRDYVNIAIYLNGTAPDETFFRGNGELACVGFTKRPGMTEPVDTLDFWIEANAIVESYWDKATPRNNTIQTEAEYTTYIDSIFVGQLVYWSDDQPISYNVDRPTRYHITKVQGCGTAPESEYAVPAIDGTFEYEIRNGNQIDIRRDIDNSTNVMKVINAQDAYLVRTYLVGLTSGYNDYQRYAMDVNMDGRIQAGDVSFINQRTVKILGQYHQEWNHGVTEGPDTVSKDWIWVEQDQIPATQIDNVPAMPFCFDVDFSANGCDIDFVTYEGILLGDVDNSYAGISRDGKIKSANAVMNFDAVVDGEQLLVPVSFNSVDAANALDFAISFDNTKLAFAGIDLGNDLDLVLTNSTKNEVLFTASTLSSYEAGEIAIVRFDVISNATVNDVQPKLALVNGQEASIISSEATAQVAAVNVFPNPAQDLINVELENAAVISIYNIDGKLIATRDAKAGISSFDVKDLAAGSYIIKVDNQEFNLSIVK